MIQIEPIWIKQIGKSDSVGPTGTVDCRDELTAHPPGMVDSSFLTIPFPSFEVGKLKVLGRRPHLPDIFLGGGQDFRSPGHGVTP